MTEPQTGILERAEIALDAILGRSVGALFDAMVVATATALVAWLGLWLLPVVRNPQLPIQVSALFFACMLLSILFLAGTTVALLLVLRRKIRKISELESHKCPPPPKPPTVKAAIPPPSSRSPGDVGVIKVEHPARVNWEVRILATVVPPSIRHATILNKEYPLCDCGGTSDWHQRSNGYRDGDKGIFCTVCGKKLCGMNSEDIFKVRKIVENMAVAQYRKQFPAFMDDRR